MAFDQDLADRLRPLFEGEATLREKRMFGGLAFLVDGAMAVCASHDGGLLVRIAPEDMDALRTDERLPSWVRRAVAAVR